MDVDWSEWKMPVIGAVILTVILIGVVFSAPVVTVEAEITNWQGKDSDQAQLGFTNTQEMMITPYQALNVELKGCDYFRTEDGVEIQSCGLKLLPSDLV